MFQETGCWDSREVGVVWVLWLPNVAVTWTGVLIRPWPPPLATGLPQDGCKSLCTPASPVSRSHTMVLGQADWGPTLGPNSGFS